MTLDEAKELPENVWVYMTADGLRQRLHRGKIRIGQFKGITRDGHFIRVLPHGLKTVTIYHPKFWDAAEAVERRNS